MSDTDTHGKSMALYVRQVIEPMIKALSIKMEGDIRHLQTEYQTKIEALESRIATLERK